MENSPDSRWYVVNTKPGAENKAAWHLENQGFRVFLPRYLKRRSHARRVDQIRAPLFPRYLFVELDAETARWRAIRSTIGVSSLICNGNTPTPAPVGIVEDILERADDNDCIAVTPTVSFAKGDAVRITFGALTDSIGRFERISDEERVILLLDLMGRRVEVKLPLDAVTALG